MSHTMTPCKPRSSSVVFPSRGLTLAELLMAATIVTVVLIGLGAAMLAMRKLDATFATDTTVHVQLRGIGENIRYAALKAAGTTSNPGIFVDSSLYDMCFRLPATDSPSPANPPTLDDPDDWIWRCYVRLGSPKTQFYSCDLPAPGTCTMNNHYVGQLALGTFSTSGPSCNKPTFTVAQDDHNLRFKLIGRKDPSEGVSPSCGGTLDKGTQNNPQEVLEYTIYPEAHSF